MQRISLNRTFDGVNSGKFQTDLSLRAALTIETRTGADFGFLIFADAASFRTRGMLFAAMRPASRKRPLARFSFVTSTRAKARNNITRSGPLLPRDMVPFCFPLAPIILGMILGPMAEQSVRRALLISRGDATELLTRPISATLAVATLLVIAWPIFKAVRRRKAKAVGAD